MGDNATEPRRLSTAEKVLFGLARDHGAVGYPGHIQTPQIVLDALWYLQDVGLAVVERGRWATTERVVRGEWKSANECSTRAVLR